MPKPGAAAKQVALFALLVAYSDLLNSASAQSYWEMTPYKIVVRIAIDPAAAAGSKIADDLPAAIADRVDNFIGAAWELTLVEAKGQEREQILTRLDALTFEELGALPEGVDKLTALAVVARPDGLCVRAREFDVRTQTIGPIAERCVASEQLLGSAAFEVLWQAFHPIGQIDVDADQNVLLRPRAAALPVRDPTLTMLVLGDLYRPVTRKIDRKGKSSAASIQPMPWTFLVVEKTEGMTAFCKTHSGLRQALRRRRGQSEQLAIAVRPLGTSTRLTVLGRGKPPKPLPGYDVFAQVPGKKEIELVGRTDANGQIDIPVTESPVRILYVKGGGMLLARLPMVPGLDETATAEVADEDVRLALEGYLHSVADNVVDLVARQQILMARTRSRMAAGKLEDAEKFFDELRRLPTREQIAQQISEERTRNASTDPAVNAKLDKLTEESKKMLRRFLDPTQIDKLRTELNEATRNPAKAAEALPASPSATPPAPADASA